MASPQGRNYTTPVKNIKYSSNYKKEYTLSDIQKEALIVPAAALKAAGTCGAPTPLGIILGDGFIERAKPNHNARIRIEQSYPEKSEYLKSIHELL